MKVKDLIAGLQKLDPELEVILQKDSEGNGYSPCAGWEEGVYLPDTTWSGEFRNVVSGEKCDAVVLYPIN